MSPSFSIGDRIRLTAQPPYFKTADPMPMLRPPDLVAIGAEGDVTEQRAGGYWVVKFERGSFLLDSQYLAALEDGTGDGAGAGDGAASAPAESIPKPGTSETSEPSESASEPPAND
jgi:hypothetical protein